MLREWIVWTWRKKLHGLHRLPPQGQEAICWNSFARSGHAKAICGNKLYACLLRIMSHRFVVSWLNTLLGLHLGSGFYTLEYKNETRFLIYFIHLYTAFLCCQQDPFIFLHFWIPAPCELEQETLADAAKTGNYMAACMRARPWSSSLRRSVLQSRSLRAAARARLAWELVFRISAVMENTVHSPYDSLTMNCWWPKGGFCALANSIGQVLKTLQ